MNVHEIPNVAGGFVDAMHALTCSLGDMDSLVGLLGVRG
jgi:hypothetical protein